MTGSAIAMMVLMLGIFWGGFVTLLVVALRQRTSSPPDAAGAGSPQDRKGEPLD